MAVTAQQPTRDRRFKFLLTIEGTAVAAFSECTGLGTDADVVDCREGGNSTSVRKPTESRTMPSITLKRGYTGSWELPEWWQDVQAGRNDRRSGAITLRDAMGNEIIRWIFRNVWPIRLLGVSAEPDSQGFAIEELDLIVETLELSEKGRSCE